MSSDKEGSALDSVLGLRGMAQHLTKIVVALAAMLLFAWNIRGDYEARAQAVEQNTRALERVQAQLDDLKREVGRIDARLWRVKALPTIKPYLHNSRPGKPK